MYQKNYIVLLLSNIICALLLSFSKGYFADAGISDNAYISFNNSNLDENVVTYFVMMDESVGHARTIDYEMLEHKCVIDVNPKDVDVLMKIVEAEAGCEDRTGKLLVANVVINRVKSPRFPNTVTDVVYQKSQKVTQFSPVSTGSIDRVKVSDETKEVVYSALYGEDESKGALYFMARKYSDPENVRWFDDNLTLLFSHGGHEFFS